MFTSVSGLINKLRKVALILVLIAMAIAAIDFFFRDGKLMRALLVHFGGSISTAGEWAGYWRVTTPDGTYTLEISEGDSVIRDNVFHSSGKWKFVADDVTPGTLLVESAGRQTAFSITQKSTDQIMLSSGVTLSRVGSGEGSTVSLFGKLRGAINNTFVVAPTYEQTDSLYKAYLPVWDEYDNVIFGGVMLKQGRFWIASFSSPSERHVVASIDTISQTINLGKYIAAQGVQGECGAQFSIDPSSPATIKLEYACMEGDPEVSYFRILSNGDIVRKDASAAGMEYFDEGFYYAPLVPTIQRLEFEEGKRLSTEDRLPRLESMISGTSPEGGLFEYGITVIKEQFIAMAASTSPITETCDWVCAISELSGINPLRTDVEIPGFNYVNPQFVKWAFANMVPEPSERFAGVTAHELYIKAYRRAARIYTLAYLELYHIPGEVTEYEDASRQEGFYGPEYLQKRYGSTLGDYVNEMNAGDNILHPPQAFGFWLRRGLDNTSKDIWDGLSGVMMRYDPVWFREKLQKYQIESVYNSAVAAK